MNKVALFFCTILGLFVVLCALRADEPTMKISPIEQDVIEALLTQGMLKSAKQRVLVDMTQPFLSRMNRQHIDEWRRLWPDDPKFKEALDDYLMKNDTAAQVTFRKAFPKDIRVISEDTLRGIYSKGSQSQEFELFIKQFPESDGPIYVSRPGLDSQQKIAIIGMATTDEGRFYYLEKNGEKWALSDKMMGPMWEN